MQDTIFSAINDVYGDVSKESLPMLLDKETKLNQNVILFEREIEEVKRFLKDYNTQLENNCETLVLVRKRIGKLMVEYTSLADNSNYIGE